MFTLRIACSPSALPTAVPLQLSEVELRPGRFSSLQRKLESKGLMKMDSRLRGNHHGLAQAAQRDEKGRLAS